MHPRPGPALLTSLLLLSLLAGCALRTGVQRELLEADDLLTEDRDADVLKAHMLDGRVAVLEEWEVSPSRQEVEGHGSWLDADRGLLERGSITVAVDSVALFETNSQVGTESAVGFAGLTLLSGVVTVACLTNPKACFGSCPTFYLDDGLDEGPDAELVAEGFSSSIAPSLEATDHDALGARRIDDGLSLRVTNEAYETHSIRHADLLAVKVGPDERVGRLPDGRYRSARELLAPRRATGPEGDCRDLLAERDGRERSSPASETDLAEREIVELVFDLDASRRGRPLGLLVDHRQSLMSTWLFYQGLAYLGSSAGHWLAELERGRREVGERTAAVGRRLGGIEILRRDATGAWRTLAELHETGPLAIDRGLVELGTADGDSLHLRIRMARGLWRLDALRLATLGAERTPRRHRPVRVQRRGEEGWTEDPNALRALTDPTKTLVTLPGDELRLHYDFARSGRHELFLESRGWYLEWMREEWEKEESPWMAAQLFLAPGEALRRLAPQYKKVEAEMEPVFWGSRYASP